MTRASRGAAEARYRDIRGAALATAQKILWAQPNMPQVSLTEIGPTALAALLEQWPDDRRRYRWPWPAMAANARRDEPSRFEAAIWSGDVLCGLALGRIRNTFCGIEFLEACPTPDHALKGRIITIAITAAATYAKLLGRAELRLIEPVPAMVPRYEALGFTLATPKGEPPYCTRTLT